MKNGTPIAFVELINLKTSHLHLESTTLQYSQTKQENFFWPNLATWIRRLLGFLGPGYLVAVGYIDPGNWATDLAGGSAFSYSLLWIILLSNFMAILLQGLSCRLGIVTGLDLAQACRQNYSRPVSFTLWILSEIAICATDLAELIGTAIALKLLFSIHLGWGVLITALDVFFVLGLQQRYMRYLEGLVLLLLMTVFLCFLAVLFMSNPEWTAVVAGYLPNAEIFNNPSMLYVAIGIIGATVMPHNLYLHSSIVQTQKYLKSYQEKKEALKFSRVDTVIALTLAFFINSAILITCATVFYYNGQTEIRTLEEAHRLLNPLLGTVVASFLFGFALLAAGLSSTMTTTLAGQIVMEGFMKFKMAPWKRRLLTRSIAMIPALITTWSFGEKETAKLLVLSQVILSLQLPFAIIPLLQFTSSKEKMGQFVNSTKVKVLSWLTAAGIIVASLKLVADAL